MSRVVRFLVGWIIFAGASLAFAGIHPVPLDKNTDPAKCAECHADKAKGKFVHSAIAMGCTSCHEIRVNQGCHSRQADHRYSPGAVPYLSRRQQCRRPERHGASAGGSRLRQVSRPAPVRQQVSVAEADLRRQEQNLCLECHTQGVNVPARRQPSRSARHGLRHLPRYPQDRRARQSRSSTSISRRRRPALCLDCHDAKDAALIKAHQGQPFATANCVQCHNPHQSASAQADAGVHPSAVCDGIVRYLPSAGQGRQGGADAGGCRRRCA